MNVVAVVVLAIATVVVAMWLSKAGPFAVDGAATTLVQKPAKGAGVTAVAQAAPTKSTVPPAKTSTKGTVPSHTKAVIIAPREIAPGGASDPHASLGDRVADLDPVETPKAWDREAYGLFETVAEGDDGPVVLISADGPHLNPFTDSVRSDLAKRMVRSIRSRLAAEAEPGEPAPTFSSGSRRVGTPGTVVPFVHVVGGSGPWNTAIFYVVPNGSSDRLVEVVAPHSLTRSEVRDIDALLASLRVPIDR